MSDKLGRYELVAELGRGGMGVVHRARDPELGREVAIKELILASTIPESERTETIERFKREGLAAMRLKHPNIVSVYEMDSEGDRFFMVMELVDGQSLGHYLDKRTPFSYQQVVDIGTQICAALDYAHQAGVVHRDIKPDNIQIQGSGQVKLMDFGVARVKSDLPGLTQTGMTLGTIAYISPEQLTDSRDVDGRADIFSLGALFYEMLTFKTPFDAGNLGGTILRIMNETPVPPAQINPHIPPKLEAVILRALKKNREERFQRAAEMQYALQEAIRGMPEAAHPIAVPNQDRCRYCQAALSMGSRVCPECGKLNSGGNTLSRHPDPSGLPSRPDRPQISAPLAPNRPQLTLPSPSGSLPAPSAPLSEDGGPRHATPANRPAAATLTLPGSASMAAIGPVRGLAFVLAYGRGGLGQTEFNQTRGLAFDSKGRLYVCDTENGRVQIFDQAGALVGQIQGQPGHESFRFPKSIGIDAQGMVYVTDDLDYRIYKFDLAGRPIGTWKRGRTQETPPAVPGRILISPGGFIFLSEPTNRRVMVFDANERQVGILSDGLAGPSGLAMDSQGRLYVMDSTHALVVIFEKTGKFLSSFGQKGAGAGQFSVPRDVAVDRAGNIFVADTLNHRIQVFDPQGTHLLSFGQKGSKPAEFNAPEGLQIGPDDRLYVADRGNGRVQVFSIGR
ncbi:MAG: protein kinase [Cyanobacteria bacterium REEB65]|nr:protein kinase [Cyanobacteria bacterium REEB65]